MADNVKKDSNFKTDHRNHMLSKERKVAEKTSGQHTQEEQELVGRQSSCIHYSSMNFTQWHVRRC